MVRELERRKKNAGELDCVSDWGILVLFYFFLLFKDLQGGEEYRLARALEGCRCLSGADLMESVTGKRRGP